MTQMGRCEVPMIYSFYHSCMSMCIYHICVPQRPTEKLTVRAGVTGGCELLMLETELRSGRAV